MTDRLTAALQGLPVEWPDVPTVDPRPEPASRVRRVPAIAIAVALVLMIVLAPVRDAVADLFGIGVVRVVEVSRLPEDLTSELDLGDAADLRSLDRWWPDSLGIPTAAFARPDETSVVWLPAVGLPAVGDSGVGAILTRFGGTLDPTIEKSIGAGTAVRVIPFGESSAYWIEGEPHGFVYLDRTGRPLVGAARLAGNTLLWEADGFTWRFESGLTLEDVQALSW